MKTFEDIRIAVAGFEALGKMPPKSTEWLKQIEPENLLLLDPRNVEGVARKIGSELVALMRMGYKPDPGLQAIVLHNLNTGQRKDGGFGKGGRSRLGPGNELPRDTLLPHAGRSSPRKAALLREFVAKCRNDDGGYGVAPGEKSAVGPTYFASIILHWLDEK